MSKNVSSTVTQCVLILKTLAQESGKNVIIWLVCNFTPKYFTLSIVTIVHFKVASDKVLILSYQTLKFKDKFSKSYLPVSVNVL